MSKRRTKAEEIKHPENYFNRYITLEIRKDKEKNKSITLQFVHWRKSLRETIWE